MTAVSSEVLLQATEDRIRRLTLNRPTSRNALSAELRERFFGALRAAEADDEVDVIIITGADPAFCAGLDLGELGSKIPDLSPQWPDMTKPVIGAINGPAITGGLELALYCDILVASDKAMFADTHARVGLMPGWGMAVRLPQVVGRQTARRMSLGSEFLSAHQALAAGLVSQVVPHAELLKSASALASAIGANNQRAVRSMVALFHRIDAASDSTGLALEADALAEWLSGDDTRAAIEANREAVIQRGRLQTHSG